MKDDFAAFFGDLQLEGILYPAQRKGMGDLHVQLSFGLGDHFHHQVRIGQVPMPYSA